MSHFVITHDQLAQKDVRRVFNSPSADESVRLRSDPIAKLGGEFFRLKDDDGQVYYCGKFFGDVNSEDAFMPLDWAEAEAGCTSIEYQAHGFKTL